MNLRNEMMASSILVVVGTLVWAFSAVVGVPFLSVLLGVILLLAGLGWYAELKELGSDSDSNDIESPPQMPQDSLENRVM